MSDCTVNGCTDAATHHAIVVGVQSGNVLKEGYICPRHAEEVRTETVPDGERHLIRLDLHRLDGEPE